MNYSKYELEQYIEKQYGINMVEELKEENLLKWYDLQYHHCIGDVCIQSPAFIKPLKLTDKEQRYIFNISKSDRLPDKIDIEKFYDRLFEGLRVKFNLDDPLLEEYLKQSGKRIRKLEKRADSSRNQRRLFDDDYIEDGFQEEKVGTFDENYWEVFVRTMFLIYIFLIKRREKSYPLIPKATTLLIKAKELLEEEWYQELNYLQKAVEKIIYQEFQLDNEFRKQLIKEGKQHPEIGYIKAIVKKYLKDIPEEEQQLIVLESYNNLELHPIYSRLPEGDHRKALIEADDILIRVINEFPKNEEEEYMIRIRFSGMLRALYEHILPKWKDITYLLEMEEKEREEKYDNWVENGRKTVYL